MAATEAQRKKFGQKLRQYRLARGLSLDALAYLLIQEGHNASSGKLSGWERGEYAPRYPEIVEALESLLMAKGQFVKELGFMPTFTSLATRIASGGKKPEPYDPLAVIEDHEERLLILEARLDALGPRPALRAAEKGPDPKPEPRRKPRRTNRPTGVDPEPEAP